MTATQYMKRPVVVEAMQLSRRNGDLVLDFMAGADAGFDVVTTQIWIRTLEGVMRADVGDYVIREPFPTGDRRFYPCKPDIFEATYMAVEEDE